MRCITCRRKLHSAEHIARVDGELEVICEECLHKAIPFLKEVKKVGKAKFGRGFEGSEQEVQSPGVPDGPEV